MNTSPPLDLPKVSPVATADNDAPLLNPFVWMPNGSTERVIIPWSEMPLAVQRYLAVHHTHMLGRVCEFTPTPEGLLIEEVHER